MAGQTINIVNAKNLLDVAKNPNARVIIYDPLSGLELNTIKVSDLVGGEAVQFPWLPVTTYMTDDLAEWNSKIWKSLVDNNTANQPAENSFWTEVSASTNNGTALQPWAAGVFSIVNSSVTYANAGYLLNSTQTLPYNSTDFATELAANKWLPLGGGSGASTAANVIVDATDFNGNLATTDTNQKLVNQKFDALPIWINDSTAWVGNETTLTLTSQKRRLFGSVAVTTAVTVTLIPPPTPYLEHYFFKFKHGTGGSFSFTGVTLAPDTPALVVGSIYEASITDGVLRYQKAVS